MPVTGASLEALGRVLCQYSALGARTGRALQNGLHAGRKQSIGHPFSSHQKFGRAMLPDNEVVMKYLEENLNGVIPDTYQEASGRLIWD